MGLNPSKKLHRYMLKEPVIPRDYIEYPDFFIQDGVPHWNGTLLKQQHMERYLKARVRHYNMLSNIKFNTKVSSVVKQPDGTFKVGIQ